VILITGCSSGFGLLTAAHLASKGHHVIATMRDLKRKTALLETVREKGGVVDLFQLDVTDAISIRTAIRDVAAKYGHIDVLINNAGYGIGGFFEDLTEEEIRHQFETNFFGVLNVTRAVLLLMRPQRKGKIINISSVAGLSSSPALSAYNASKWALEGFTESLRCELKFFGIDVLLIEPGLYRTRIFYENARYAKNFLNPDSPYYPISRFLGKRTRERVERCRKNPQDIALLVEKLILASRPPFRNIPDPESQAVVALRRILPFGLYSRLLRRAIFRGLDFHKK